MMSLLPRAPYPSPSRVAIDVTHQSAQCCYLCFVLFLVLVLSLSSLQSPLLPTIPQALSSSVWTHATKKILFGRKRSSTSRRFIHSQEVFAYTFAEAGELTGDFTHSLSLTLSPPCPH